MGICPSFGANEMLVSYRQLNIFEDLKSVLLIVDNG